MVKIWQQKICQHPKQLDVSKRVDDYSILQLSVHGVRCGKTTSCGTIPVAKMFAKVKLYAKLSNKKQGDTMHDEKSKSKVG